MRCLLRELGRAARKHNIGGWRQWRHLTQEVKKCFNKVRSTRRAKSRPDRVEAYIERCCHLVGRAEDSCKELEHAGVAQSTTIQALIAHARRQMDQVERRLLKGETIAHDEKVFSIFEEHTRWVSKGKAGCAVDSEFRCAWLRTNTSLSFTTRFCGKGAIPILRDHRADAGTASRPTGVQLRPWVPQPRQPGAARRLDLNALPRKGRLSVSSARKRKHLPRPGASTRRSSRQSTTLSIAVSTGCAPAAPMGLHTPLHCRYWPPTCTASVCLCDGACVRPNDVEDAGLPERGHLLRISLPGPAHGGGNGLRCPEVGNAGRFDAKHRSVVPVRWVPWPRPRRMCGGSSQISCESGSFLADTK